MKTDLKNNWSLLMISGLISLFYGVLAIFASRTLIISVVTYLGIIILITGIVMLYSVYTNYVNKLPYVYVLIQAIIFIVLGVLLTFFSQKSLQIFVVIMGAWVFLIGGIQLHIAIKIPNDNNEKNSFIINGIISLALGVLLLFNPFKMATIVVVLSGLLAVLIGGLLIFLSIKLKNHRVNIDIND